MLELKPGQKYIVEDGRLRLMTDEEVRRWEETLDAAFGPVTGRALSAAEVRARVAEELKGISVSQIVIESR